MSKCISHHYACDCREEQHRAAISGLRAIVKANHTELDRLRAIVAAADDLRDACDVVGPDWTSERQWEALAHAQTGYDLARGER